MEQKLKNPYFSMSDFNRFPSKEEADFACHFNRMIAELEFVGKKFTIDGKNTPEYNLFLRWHTQPNEVIMTEEEYMETKELNEAQNL